MSHYSPPTPNRYWLLALLVLLLATVFYIHSINTTYITADEYLVYRFTRGTLAETVSYLANSDVHPPLWFSFFWGWRRLTGDSDFSGRIQAILFSMLTLSLVYQIGRRWFGAARYGLFAMVILSVSALFFHYSLEIRPYALAMFLASLSMVAFQQWLRRGTWRSAVVYAGTVAALLYIHYFLFIFILAQLAYFIFNRPARRLCVQAGSVAVLAFVFWSLWFPSFLSQLGRIRAVELASGAARGIAGSSVTTQPTSIQSISALLHLATNGQLLLYAGVLLIGFVFCWRKANYRLAVTWAIGMPFIAFALNMILAVYTPRYIVNFVIGLALVLAVGLAIIPRRLGWAGLIVFIGISFWGLPSQLPSDIVPYRSLYQDLIHAAKPGDVVFFDRQGYGDDVTKWVWKNIVPESLRANATTDIEETLQARRIWHITGDWFNPGVRENFSRIEQTHPRRTGFGQCDTHWCYLIQLMEAPPWNEPKIFGEDMAFWGADVDSVTETAIQTRLWWKVEQTPHQDYSIGLHLLDPNGVLVAQQDGPITHYGQQSFNTSQLEPDRIYVDFRMLDLSPTLQPGNYTLKMVVYDWQTGNHLYLPDGTDYLLLDQINLSDS